MTIERRPWLGYLNTETGLREARDGLTIGKIYTVTAGQKCNDDDGRPRERPESDWGDPVAPQLARDELYMRLRNEARLPHQQALDFIAECGNYEAIRHALDNQPNTGHVMAALVLWVGDNEKAYREGAGRCGWGY